MSAENINIPQQNQYTAPQMEPEEEGIDFHAIFVKFMINWPWFLLSVIICIAAAMVYLRFKQPQYAIEGSVLITEDNHSKPRAGQIDLQSLSGISMTSVFDNEIEILQSRTLIKKVVADLGLYVDIAIKHKFAAPSTLYKNSPVNVFVPVEVADTLPTVISLEIEYHTNGSCDVKSSYSLHRELYEATEHIATLPAVIKTEICNINLNANPEAGSITKDVTLLATVMPLVRAAAVYSSKLTVEPVSKTTTIAMLTCQDSHPKRGEDFLNRLVYMYNQDANEDKNQEAQRTAEFIEDRINLIKEELGNAETKLASFKETSGLTNLSNDAQLALNQNAKYEQESVDNATQIHLVESLNAYISDPSNKMEVIPVNIGLKDNSLSSVINDYNKNLLECKRLQRTTSEDNPAWKQALDRLTVLRSSVEASIASTLNGLRITQSNIDKQGSVYKKRIASTPGQEKDFLSMSRQQEIMATLYTLLLQKREENSITLAATANNGRIIEEPMSSFSPVSPSKSKILLIAIVLGLCIPAAVLYLIDVMKYNIENINDVESLTKLPILGELPLLEKNELNGIVVRENHNGKAEEAFRAMRTNLMYMLKRDQNVIMFSSTKSGEGKSFVAANTALSIANLGKKVLVVGLDIRKPGLNKTFGFSRRTRGVTDFLVNPDYEQLEEHIIHGQSHDNVDVLPGGVIPPNPTELLARDTLDMMVDYLKKKYDYVVLDTAPIGMLSDSNIAARVADICIYVCRAEVTPKAGFEFVNRLAADKKFDQIAVVLNGLDTSKRKNNSTYAQRYGYGYGYGSSYGYGYGYGQEDSKAKTKQETRPATSTASTNKKS